MQSDTLADVLQQTFTGIFDQIEYLLESVMPAVIGIRHHRGIMSAAEFCQSSQFPAVLVRATLLGQRKIVPVHRQQQIMVREIIARDLACSEIGEIIAASLCVALAALIGRLPGMVVVRSCGIHADLMFQPVLPDEMAEHAMRCRAAADIPHAEEQNAERWPGFCRCCHSGFRARNEQRNLCGAALYCGL